MKIEKPLGDKVYIKIEKAPLLSKGGIYDPQAGKRKMPIGRILDIGDKVKRRDLIGKYVYFDIYEGWRIDELELLIEEDFIYMIIEKGDEDV